MKILQVNVVYKKGSTGKITYDIHKCLLDSGIESVVCYGRGKRVKEPGVFKTCSEWYSKFNNALSRFTGIMYGGCFFSTNKLISSIKKEKPNIVHLQCVNGYFVNIYRLISWLNKCGIKTLLTLHAEFMYTANCGHALDCDCWKTGCGNCPRRKTETKSFLFDKTGTSWKKMKKAFDGFEKDLMVVSVSPWLMDRAKQSPILKNMRHCFVFNGVNTDVFHPYDTTDLRKSHHCEGKKVVFHATTSFSADINHLKGGYYILELARNMPEVQFIVAGKCDGEIEVSENVILLGQLTDQVMLAHYYSMADVTVITSKKETFSMVVAESLCCGTPVVGFKAGAPEQIAIAAYSDFVEYGDMSKLMESVSKKITLFEAQSESVFKAAYSRYDSKVMFEKYMKLYESILRNSVGEK